MRLLFTLFITISLAFISAGQTKIEGKITDKKNAPLLGANVFIKDSYDGTSSTEDGTFSFTTDEEGNATLIVSYIGYETIELEILLDGKTKFFPIIMEERTAELGTVVVSAGSFEVSDENKGVILRPLDIVLSGADADIYTAIETLPGTQQIGETDGLFVRGGSASETKTIIDEMIVQSPFYTSVPDIPGRGRFSPFLFKGTVFSTGGYSAQYGQALSSVLVLKTQDLPERTQTAINLMALGVGGSHTQRWENSSLSFEGGYYNMEPYYKLQKQRVEWDKSPESFEGSLNFRQKVGTNGLLKAYTSFGYGDMSLFTPNLNNQSQKDYTRIKGGNLFINTNYRDFFENDWTIFAGYSFSIDYDKFTLTQNKATQDEIFHTGKLIISKRITGSSFVTFGGEVLNILFKDSYNSLNSRLMETYYAGFAETDIFFTNDIAARVGIRSEYSKILNKYNFAPRVSLAYRLGTYDQLNFAYGQFYQTPEKDFLIYTNDFQYEKATHYIFNYQYLGTRRTFRLELYYKDYNNLVKGTVYTYPYLNVPVVPFSNDGKGYAKGIDVFWRDKETFKYTDYWISYTYIDTRREFKNYPSLAFPTFATPHTFSIVAKRWIQEITTSVGLIYTFATGRPYFNPNNPEFLGDRSKNYQNLSLNISYITNIFGNFSVIFFTVDNLIGYSNVYGYRFSDDGRIKMPVVPTAFRWAFLGVFISLGETASF